MGRASDVAMETLAIGMVGDGVVAGTFARRHIMLWDFARAPRWYRRLVRSTAERPWLVRAIATAQAGLGMWWVYRLTRRHA